MKLGVAISYPLLPIAASLELAKAAETSGFDLISAGDGYNETFSLLTAAVMRTERISLLFAVVTPTRTPVAMALAAAGLAEISGSRYLVGLGVMPRDRSKGWHGIPYEHPIERMRELVSATRAVWAARPDQPARFEGSFYRVGSYAPDRVRPELPIPVYLGVTRAGVSRLAGEIAEGVIVNAVHSVEFLSDVVLAAIARGLADGNRRRSQFRIGVLQHCASQRVRSAARIDTPPAFPQ
ncbi:MAG: LLM class flavin-dependent oxidoreductase [Acidobacteria bacterium]|nr:LLM class flavin-dependent oxidoreductase [Acidobacteriota bacterium]